MSDYTCPQSLQSIDHVCQVLQAYMGNYGSGVRNFNGDALLSFMGLNNLYATNTCFKHPVRHITTRINHIKDWSAGRHSSKTVPFYSQIDYILCRSNLKSLLVNSRSYGGTLVKSDHKLVITKIDYNDIFLAYPKRSTTKRYDCENLTCNVETQINFQEDIHQRLTQTPTLENANDEMNNIFNVLKASAENRNKSILTIVTIMK